MRTKAAIEQNLPSVHAAIAVSDSLAGLSRQALEAAGVLESWQAAAAIRLAEVIDTYSRNIAQNVLAHRQAMEHALAQGGEKADVVSLIFKDTP